MYRISCNRKMRLIHVNPSLLFAFRSAFLILAQIKLIRKLNPSLLFARAPRGAVACGRGAARGQKVPVRLLSLLVIRHIKAHG